MSRNVAFQIGLCRIDQDLDRISKGNRSVTVRPQVMNVLAYLAARAGQPVHSDELIDKLWPGKVVSSASVYNCITELRRAFLQCDEGQSYVDTIPKKGYRLIAPVSNLNSDEPQNDRNAKIRDARLSVIAAVSMLAVGLLVFAVKAWWPHEPQARSIAVLPFQNRSASPEDVFFVDGIHDDILTRLANTSAFERVISRASVERYRNTTLPVSQIGRELGVAAIVQGGVQRAGDRVQISVQLIDTLSDNHQWAETYQRELTAENIFAIQAEVAEAIVDAMKATVSNQDRQNLDTVPTRNMLALEHYFRGRDQLRHRTTTSLRVALDEFRSAIAIDPDFALAHATIAEAYEISTTQAVVSREEMQVAGRKHVARAISLDPDLGEAYSALGAIELYINPVAAESALRKAIQLSPNNIYAHYNYCWLLGITLGQFADALPRCQKAQSLDPFSPIVVTTIGSVFWGLDRLQEAQSHYDKANRMDAEFVVSRIMRGYLDWKAFGMLHTAEERIKYAFSLDPENPHAITSLAEIYLDLGDTDQSAFWINQLVQLLQSDGTIDRLEALLNIRRGDTAAAVKSAFAHFDPEFPQTDWTLRILRDDALEHGRIADARELYKSMYPELFGLEISSLTPSNFRIAVDLAEVLTRNGELQQANTLLELAQDQISALSRGDPHFGYGVADVNIHTIMGNPADAISALSEAVNSGWRYQWWLHLQHDLALKPLHNEPEFRKLVREIERDMQEQLERIRQSETGEILEEAQ